MTRLCIFLLLLTILHQSRVSAMTCRRLPEHFKIRCVNASVSVGNYLQCRCLENCRPFTLKCLESGTFEKMDYFLYCSENQYKTEVEFASGRKVRLSFKNKYFEEQCREGIIRADMVDVCNRDGFKKDNLPLCDHTCNNPPTELECPRNVYRSSEGYIRCLCKQNCLYMRSRCEVGDTLSELASCREAYAIANFYLGDSFDPQETVNATYTPSFLGNSSPEIQCPSGEKTITPGKITCSNGSAKVLTPPSCETNTSLSAVTISLISSAVIAILIAILLLIIYIILTKLKKNRTSPKVENDEVIYDEIDLSKVFPNVAPELPPRFPETDLVEPQVIANNPGQFRGGGRPFNTVARSNVLQNDVDQEGYFISTSGRIVDERAVRRIPKPPQKRLPVVPLINNMEQKDVDQDGYVVMSASKKFSDSIVAGAVSKPFIKHSKKLLRDDVNEGGYINTVSNKKR